MSPFVQFVEKFISQVITAVFMIVVVIALGIVYIWSVQPASPEKIAQAQRDVREFSIKECRVSDHSTWNFFGYPAPEQFIDKQLANNIPVRNHEIWRLNDVIDSCHEEFEERKENERIAALQRSAAK